MRKLNTSAITTSIAMPVKSGTLDHIQNAYVEAISEAVKALIGVNYSNSVMYILSGLVNVGTFPNYNITQGAVFFNGEIYLIDAVNFTLASGQVAVCKIVTTQFTGINADSVLFSDLTPRNVHDIRKVVISADFGGSGISNYVDGVRINSNRPDVNLIEGTGITITGTYPNKTITNSSPNTPEIIAKGSIPIGDLNTTTDLDAFTALLSSSTSGLSGYKYTFPVALPSGTNYYVLLTVCNDGYNTVAGFANNSMVVAQVGAYDNLGFNFALSTSNTGVTQAITIKYQLISA